MRLLFNAMQAGNQSGTGRYVEELLPALLDLDGDLRITVWWPGSIPAPPWADRVELVPQPRALGARVLRECRFKKMRRDFDVVHFPATIGPLDGGDNVVVTVHDCIFLRHPEWFRWERAQYYRWAGRRSIRRAARVIADSRATARDVHDLLGVPRDRIDTIPLGVDLAFHPRPEAEVAAARTRHGLPERYFLYVGTLEPRKNLARLVRAWDQIAGDIPDALVIAGRPGWKTRPFDAAVRAARHRDRILLPGFLPDSDLPALLTGARAFVWPSLYEGFGLPVLEAMACGAPVITSNTSGLSEVAGDGAIRVEPEDEDAIRAALHLLSTDGERTRQLRERGLKQASNYTWRQCAQSTLETYQGVAGRCGQS